MTANSHYQPEPKVGGWAALARAAHAASGCGLIFGAAVILGWGSWTVAATVYEMLPDDVKLSAAMAGGIGCIIGAVFGWINDEP